MLKLYHTNSEGETLDFLELGIYITEMSLRDYEWSYESENDIITKFTKGITSRTIPLAFYCDKSKANEIKNTFFEHFEKDIVNFEKGYFQLNDYKFYCYITKNEKDDYLEQANLLKIDVEITTDQPYWVKETTYQFGTYNRLTDVGKIYSYTYDYTYGSEIGNANVALDDALNDCNFKMIIYGSVNSPEITIGGWLYAFNVTLSSNEYLVIDSKNKTAIVVDSKGNETNVFNKRNFDYSPFEKLKAGYSSVSWSGSFGFDIITYEERSEPKWI